MQELDGIEQSISWCHYSVFHLNKPISVLHYNLDDQLMILFKNSSKNINSCELSG